MSLKKINWKSFSINFLLCVLSTIISEFGIGCYYGCGLGTDPISVFVDGLHAWCNLSYGTISTICNVILTACIFLFLRKHLGIGTIVGMFIGGPLIDVFETLVRTNFPIETTSLFVRIIILTVALVTFAIGCGLGIACNMGIGSFQFAPLFLEKVTKISLTYTQMITDAMFFLIGWLLGGVVGIGTIASVLLTGPILTWSIKIFEKPIKKVGPIFQD